ncbi:molybdopterin-binding protein [Streptomyces sp. NPDC093094]|uniref:TOBE domain-containing protein n=1 Tax=Streptomyces sp. NPDC093094 TaxID=3366026 RepID=UPI003802EA45
MRTYRIGDAAVLPGVSADTVRRPVDGGKPVADRDGTGHRIVPGPAFAAHARQLHHGERETSASSARNRFTVTVTVTDVIPGDVSVRPEIQAGPFRVVAVVSRESAEGLRPEPGAPAVGVIKSTDVVVGRP